ncbi:MAG: fused MFS/spermidine synthase [Pirellulales bacterium]|nr:fused MFS/spermidine synthase [Pirellulales bacterium]
MLLLYSSAIFLSAVLLFSLELMVGKMLLPRCGGAASVWNTCMVFFQAVLLLGYAYAHLSTRLLGARRQAMVHLAVVLLPWLVLPVLFRGQSGPTPDQNPSLWLLLQLTAMVGLPFLVVSATTPLLQRWFVQTGHVDSGDPYFLYSTSNVGSLLALLSYPFLIEPGLGLLRQKHYWTAGYALLSVLILGCATVMWLASRQSRKQPLAPDPSRLAAVGTAAQLTTEDNSEAVSPHPSPLRAPTEGWSGEGTKPLRQRLYWICLAFIPSSLMLGVTTHIATDIASVPLLWVMPLVLYLLSFAIVFARRPILSRGLMIAVMPFAVLLLPAFFDQSTIKFWIAVPGHLLTFFIVAMVCHGELASSRPEAGRLTEFYLWMSLGGVIGGIFNALVAPLVFSWVLEYPLMLAAACFFRPAGKGGASRTTFNRRDAAWLAVLIVVAWTVVELSDLLSAQEHLLVGALLYAVPALICLGFNNRPLRFAFGITALYLTAYLYVNAQFGDTLLAKRNFYGVKRVRKEKNRFHCLINGNIIHGLQEMYPRPSAKPLGYYYRSGPLGDILNGLNESKSLNRVAVIGLGTGTIAAYARPGQHYTFYEIDPMVIRLANDPGLFTYLTQCRGRCDVIEGDARLQIAQAPDGRFDAIILDAFSSDSIPLHLLTQEALQLYCRKLKPDGVLVFHISNRYLNLRPALAALAEKNHLVCLARDDFQVSDEEDRNAKYRSDYLVMARRLSHLGDLSKNPQWTRPKSRPGFRVWTDDYSNILSVMEW